MSMSIGSFLGCLFGDRHYTRKGRSMLFFCRFPLKSRFLEGLDTKKQVVFDTTVLSERENSMRNRIVKVTEVVVRSAFYIISNYVFVSMGLSFHTQWISILFLLSMVWSTIDYGKSINEITEKKVIAEILCICCIALSIAMAYFVGYIQGAFVSL